ncbi:hypothetical protein V1514DRAFT_332695 [Lipomyces japonicus]|uniref:uncharacterized protein n=1 Tax=Lipomyces japonicus TaxID=56871 RepID=UPI0034CFFEEB
MSAFQRRPNFYSACVYISQSNACLMILANMGAFFTVILGRVVQTILFGPLRAIELEHLYEKTWYAVTETCLAMTIFREEFDVRFIAMFTALLFIKIFHWLVADRVEYFDQTTPSNPKLFHTRVSITLLLLLYIDFKFVQYSVNDIITRGPNMMVMFAFEFTILFLMAGATALRYALSLIELRIIANSNDEEDSWERKSDYMLRIDIASDFLKLLVYLGFFMLILTVYGLPLHIIRDVYLTLRSFLSRLRDYKRYLDATDQKYADASEEDVVRESICIICREEMVVDPAGTAAGGDTRHRSQPERKRPKRLPCGHVLHYGCLKSWLERQQRCPTCRRPVLDPATTADSRNQQEQRQQQPQAPDLAAARPVQAEGIINSLDDRQPRAQQQLHAATDQFQTTSFQLQTQDQVPTAESIFNPSLTPPDSQDIVHLPPGFYLPEGWALLPLRQLPGSGGTQQLQIRDNVWLTMSTVQFVDSNLIPVTLSPIAEAGPSAPSTGQPQQERQRQQSIDTPEGETANVDANFTVSSGPVTTTVTTTSSPTTSSSTVTTGSLASSAPSIRNVTIENDVNTL